MDNLLIWRMVLANDGTTEIRVAHHGDGDISIKLTCGAISVVAVVSASDAEAVFGIVLPSTEAA